MNKDQINRPLLVQRLAAAVGIQGDAPSQLAKQVSASVQLADLSDHQYQWLEQVNTFMCGDNGAYPGVAGSRYAMTLRSAVGIANTERLVRLRRLILSRNSAPATANITVTWDIVASNEAQPVITTASTPVIRPRDGRGTPQSAMIARVGNQLTVTPEGPRIVLPINGSANAIIPLDLTIPAGGMFFFQVNPTDVGVAWGLEWDERVPTEQEMLGVVQS